MIRKLTEDYFNELKRTLRWTTNKRAAYKHGVSLKTALQVRGSKNYEEYQEQKKAQHPKVKYSAREDLFEYLKERCSDAGIQYKKPSHMSVALYQLRQMDKLNK